MSHSALKEALSRRGYQVWQSRISCCHLLPFILHTVFFVSFISLMAGGTLAAEKVYSKDSRARLSPDSDSSRERQISYRKFALEHPFTIVSTKRWEDLAAKVYDLLAQSSTELERLFGRAPTQALSIELLGEKDFYATTGAPLWTNAMYYEGRILIPVIEPLEGESYDSIVRSVRHEYTHAYINAASAGKCPGWLDEGLAQWFEGPVNPLLSSILAKHLKTSAPIPMIYLQNGFTKLDNQIVGPAYGQSLFAAISLMKTFGFEAIGAYLAKLRQGIAGEIAFKESFGLGSTAFENKLKNALTIWVQKQQDQHLTAGFGTQVSMLQRFR